MYGDMGWSGYGRGIGAGSSAALTSYLLGGDQKQMWTSGLLGLGSGLVGAFMSAQEAKDFRKYVEAREEKFLQSQREAAKRARKLSRSDFYDDGVRYFWKKSGEKVKGKSRWSPVRDEESYKARSEEKKKRAQEYLDMQSAQKLKFANQLFPNDNVNEDDIRESYLNDWKKRVEDEYKTRKTNVHNTMARLGYDATSDAYQRAMSKIDKDYNDALSAENFNARKFASERRDAAANRLLSSANSAPIDISRADYLDPSSGSDALKLWQLRPGGISGRGLPEMSAMPANMPAGVGQIGTDLTSMWQDALTLSLLKKKFMKPNGNANLGDSGRRTSSGTI